MSTYIKPDAIKDSSITGDKLTLSVKDNGNIVLTSTDGSKEFMPATPSGDPMHYAYVTAGAIYNDTGEDIVKDAPWADMVDDDSEGYGYEYKKVLHKAGYWYLNGIGDLTNDDMRDIYLETSPFLSTPSSNVGTNLNSRTNLTKNCDEAVSKITISKAAYFRRCAKMEVIYLVKSTTTANILSTSSIGYLCPKLVHILDILDASEFKTSDYRWNTATNLISIKLKNMTYSETTFYNSPNLSMKSILYMIENEVATSAITITLHTDAYTKAMANTDILAALEAHPNISLADASATA